MKPENAKTNMKVQYTLYASLSEFSPDRTRRTLVTEVPEGTSVGELVGRLRVPSDQIKIIFVNGVHAKLDTVLKEGDRVGLFPLVAGG